MKAQDFILIGGAAFAVWWLLKTYGGSPEKVAAAPKYWVTGGEAVPDQFSSYPDSNVQGGVWV